MLLLRYLWYCLYSRRCCQKIVKWYNTKKSSICSQWPQYLRTSHMLRHSLGLEQVAAFLFCPGCFVVLLCIPVLFDQIASTKPTGWPLYHHRGRNTKFSLEALGLEQITAVMPQTVIFSPERFVIHLRIPLLRDQIASTKPLAWPLHHHRLNTKICLDALGLEQIAAMMPNILSW